MNKSSYVIVIPARLQSERLPEKVLLQIDRKVMLQHVWERASQSMARQVIVATDNNRIRKACRDFGAEVVMTDPAHRSGSDRIAEVAEQAGWPDEQVIVNLQGDEPLMPPACLDQVARLALENPEADAATLYLPETDAPETLDPNVVKVVTDLKGRALLFSRSPIPFQRNQERDNGNGWKRHIGLYAYRAGSLRAFASKAASPLEKCEQLEQLRILEYGGQIMLEQACLPIPPGVDTEEDLARVRAEI